MSVIPAGVVIAVGLFVADDSPGQSSAPDSAGRVRVARRHEPSFDRYTRSPSIAQQEWMRTHFWRFTVFSTYFDAKLRWYPNAWVYANLYGIQKESSLSREKSEWLLEDADGRRLYVPWGCSDGTCPQYAADVSNPEYRSWWIDDFRRKLARGYKGVWLDDVNLEFRVGNGREVHVPPIDRKTNAVMKYDNWRRYVAEFVEQIRAELSGYEVVHNSIWFAGPTGVRHADPYVRRQTESCDYVNVERGISDEGLTGGDGEWSLSALFRFIDDVHSLGKGVILEELGTPDLEYALAGYFLISSGRDAIADFVTTPDRWFAGYDIDLGAPQTTRYVWRGLLRRDFNNGLVLLNEPGVPRRKVKLPGSYRNAAGQLVTTVSLGPKAGAVLLIDRSLGE